MGCKIGLGILLFACLAAAQTDTVGVPDYTVEHPECVLFGPKYDQYVAKALGGAGTTPHQAEVERAHQRGSRTAAQGPAGQPHRHLSTSRPRRGSIDSYIFGALQTAGVQPAPATTDFEFIRRVTLGSHRPHSHAGPRRRLRRRHLLRQALQAGRRTDRQAGVDRQVDHVLRRPLPEQFAELADPPLSRRREGLQRLHPRLAHGQQALRPDGARDDHRHRQPTATRRAS